MAALEAAALLQGYDLDQLTVATLGSHSALDVALGAKRQAFPTLVITQQGREKTYTERYRTDGETGCVDRCVVLKKFDELLEDSVQEQLREANAVFVPNRSFEVYLHSDYDAIEQKFKVPMFGNRGILRIEERGQRPNQYDLLDGAKLRYPQQFTDPKQIDRLVLVKVLEQARGFERAFFLAENAEDYQRQVEQKLADGTFTEQQLKESVIEEFVTGVPVNFNFFYSPLTDTLELLGTDTRRQTNLEGITRLPAPAQEEILKKVEIRYEEAGHIAVTVLESMLEDIFAMGEQFVAAAKRLFAPGVIGPFALQSIITPGPPKKEAVVIDVSPRMPGSPGITATPYSTYRYGRSVGVGERVAMEIKAARETGALEKILT